MQNRISSKWMWTAAVLTGVALSGIVLGIAGCVPASNPEIVPPPLDPPEANRQVTLDTTMGQIVIELFATQSPQAVASFQQYVADKFYEGLIFHEAIAGSWVIAGAYDTDLVTAETGDPVTNESNNGLTNVRGYVALYEPDGTDSGTSQFLINLKTNASLDYDAATTERGLTVFGRVISGMDIVDEIGALPTTSRTAEDGTALNKLPTEDVVIAEAYDSTDNGGPSGPNEPPVADAGEDQTADVDTTVTLDGSGSSDPNNTDVLSYAWQQLNGPAVTLSDATAATPTFASDTVATLTFELTVIDPYGLTDSATTVVTIISDTNQPPTADAGENQTVSTGSTAQLQGSGTDPDSDPLFFAWAQTGGETVTLSSAAVANPTFTAPTTGNQTLTFELTVTDSQGGIATDNVDVTINTQPTADAGDDKTVAGRVEVMLDSSGSEDADGGDALTYAWTQTSGPDVVIDDATAASPIATMPDEDATVVFELTVSDESGSTDSDEVTFTVIRDPDVRIQTTMGDIVIDMLVDGAPATTLNFFQYVADDYYDGVIFHRVMSDFVAQAGGFLPGLVKQEPLRDAVVNEFSPDRSNVEWTVAMAKLGSDPNSATSQFFFNFKDNSENLDNQNEGFTVFAEVIDGFDVLDAIELVETETQTSPEGNNFTDVPVEDIVIEDVTLE